LTTEIRITRNDKIILLVAFDSNDICKVLDQIKEFPEIQTEFQRIGSLESFFNDD